MVGFSSNGNGLTKQKEKTSQPCREAGTENRGSFIAFLLKTAGLPRVTVSWSPPRHPAFLLPHEKQQTLTSAGFFKGEV
jgi:hypothetical protein